MPNSTHDEVAQRSNGPQFVCDTIRDCRIPSLLPEPDCFLASPTKPKIRNMVPGRPRFGSVDSNCASDHLEDSPLRRRRQFFRYDLVSRIGDYTPRRQRTQSESDATRIQPDPLSIRRRKRDRLRACTEDATDHLRSLASSTPTPVVLASSLPSHSRARESTGRPNNTHRTQNMIQSQTNNTSASTTEGAAGRIILPSVGNETPPNNNNNNHNDPERRARMRWIRINSRFQLVITIVALLFSLLLFAILICWVVLTSAYVMSFEKSCDVALKPYFWLVTLQLVLDVFRSDIMRYLFNWDSSNTNQRIPCRVITYNLTYLVYAIMVLRLGITSVFVADDSTCPQTAPELFNASMGFITLSIIAWGVIVGGYLIPFCVVAAMLTHNGYNPSAGGGNDISPVFPAAYSNTGAPPGCIEMMPVLAPGTFPAEGYPNECCICLEKFRRTDEVVETACKHVFHKQCCREWLLQARSCPMCRVDIPTNLETPPEETSEGTRSPSQIPIGPTGRPVAGLLRMLNSSDSTVSSRSSRHTGTPLRSRTASASLPESSTDVSRDVEEGRSSNRLFSRP